jgi:hypothetical protein
MAQTEGSRWGRRFLYGWISRGDVAASGSADTLAYRCPSRTSSPTHSAWVQSSRSCGNRYCRPLRRMFGLMLPLHSNGAAADFRREFVRRLAWHRPCFSRVEVSGKPRSVHTDDPSSGRSIDWATSFTGPHGGRAECRSRKKAWAAKRFQTLHKRDEDRCPGTSASDSIYFLHVNGV